MGSLKILPWVASVDPKGGLTVLWLLDSYLYIVEIGQCIVAKHSSNQRIAIIPIIYNLGSSRKLITILVDTSTTIGSMTLKKKIRCIKSEHLKSNLKLNLELRYNQSLQLSQQPINLRILKVFQKQIAKRRFLLINPT